MSLLTPDLGLLFWMLLAFGVVVFVLVKFGFPVIIKGVEDRNKYIAVAHILRFANTKVTIEWIDV